MSRFEDENEAAGSKGKRQKEQVRLEVLSCPKEACLPE